MPLEPVRFAAANHLCVELGYGGTTRLVEPYSLRQTRDGHLLFYGVKTVTGELPSYRVDRIQELKVVNTPFKPRHPIEFTPTGSLVARPMQRVAGLGARRTSSRSGVIHVIECTHCGRQFRRSTLDTRLRPHKDKRGVFDCPGRTGYEMDRR